ncbi:MAG: response regulator transcription factor [Chloroflexota bacterium]
MGTFMSNNPTLHIIFASDHDLAATGLSALVNRDGRHYQVSEIRFGEQTIRLYVPAANSDHPAKYDRRSAAPGDDLLTSQQTAMLQSVVVALAANGHAPAEQAHGADRAEAWRETRAAGSEEEPLTVHLSEREREVLALMARGLRNHEIATALSISTGTVKKHVSNILFKLEANGRTEAVARAVRANLIDDA